MIRRSSISGFVAATAVVAALVSGALGFVAVRQDLDALNRASRDNITWSTTQLEIEHFRFINALQSYRIGRIGGEETPNAMTAQQVNNRFDVLWSRLVVFQRGVIGERLTAFDGEANTAGKLFELVQSIENDVVNIDSKPIDTIDAVIGQAIPYSDDLRMLSQRVVQAEKVLATGVREDLRESAEITVVISLVGVALAILAFVYANFETRRFRRLAEHNKQLAETAEAASEAKSRFLTMMSHELRTPMNGVLGVMSLLRQSGLSKPQARLLEQAERSSGEMISMLSDILDFSALQNKKIEIRTQSFELATLITAIEDLFGAIARREGVKFETRLDSSCPQRVRGDYQRIRQVAVNLCGYLVQTAGIDYIGLSFSFGRGELIMSLEFSYPNQGGNWNPTLIIGESESSDTSFATSALGPAIARGLVDAMGGSLIMKPEQDNKISVAVSLPVEAEPHAHVAVRIIATSPAMEAICRGALSDERVVFVGENSAQQVHVIVADTGMVDIDQRITELRRDYPDALIIGVGDSAPELDVDEIFSFPLELQRVKSDFLDRYLG